MKKIISFAAAVIVLAAIGAGIWYGASEALGGKTEYVFQCEEVTRGDLQSVISASGTVEPEELVNVGAQVNGKIMNFGVDADGKTIDYGSRVTEGMLLAKIDDVLYDSALREAEAVQHQAEVLISSEEAAVKQAEARSILAKNNWERAQELTPKGALAKSEYDSCKAEYLTRQADIKVAKAALEKAKASLAIARTAVVRAKRNLDYCFIKSPVDGVIIDRRVSIGQTLVSSMSASSIFLIAKDLKKMQVWVSVNEADIGSIRPGMDVVFTVDAFGDTEFVGKVHKIRLNATMSQNVVTYVVEVATDNSNGKLLPYLTANVKFIRASRRGVLAVSNAALRFVPPEELLSSGAADAVEKLEKERLEAEAKGVRFRDRLIWVENGDGKLRPVRVTAGLNDGRRSEISGDGLAEGLTVINGAVPGSAQAGEAKAKTDGRSPFMPSMPKRRPKNPNNPK